MIANIELTRNSLAFGPAAGLSSCGQFGLKPLLISFVVFVAGCFDGGMLWAQLKNADLMSADFRQLLESSCFDCHGDSDREAGLDLSFFKTVGQLREAKDIWNNVQRRVLSGSMPPPDYDSLSQNDRVALAAWVEQALTDVDCSEMSVVGQVTLRRLNRLEYRNSIRDLLLVDYDGADAFLGDDVGYGFDNIGDVLSMPPILLEKYLTAAEVISRQVIVAPEDVAAVETPLPLGDWATEGGINNDGGRLSFFSNGTATFEFRALVAKEYLLKIQAMGQQAGDEPVQMTVMIDKKRIKRIDLPEHEAIVSIELPIKLAKGNRNIKISFDNDFYNPQAADPDRRDRNLAVQKISLTPKTAELPERNAIQKNFFFVYPERAADEADTAQRLVQFWSSHLFRRATQPEEVAKIAEVYTAARHEGSSFEQSMQFALQAMLVSPKFLYKVEEPPQVQGVARALNSFELATNLSYFLWCSAPDSELLSIANTKDLQGDHLLQAQIKRMLSDSRAQRMVDNFSEQWLQLRGLDRFEPDAQQFPDVDRILLLDLRAETQAFCREIFSENRSLLDLLNADFTYVNQRLAKHYGWDDLEITGDKLQRISLAGRDRGGLLTQGSFLTVTSNPTRTSPVKRGKWILDNLLNEPPPPAPPDVVPLEDQKLTGTFRQQLEQHRRNPSCASCHDQMDPLGLALEQFDPVGRWRTQDGGAAIDASGVLPTGETFVGAEQLRQVLLELKRDQFIRCVVEKMLTYALGRGLRYDDQCTVNDIVKRLEASEYSARELIIAICESPPFRQRQWMSDNGETPVK